MDKEREPVCGFERNDKDCSLDIDLDAKMLERLTMPNDGVSVTAKCYCEPNRSAVIQTVWVGEDKGKRVMTCALDEHGKGCRFKVLLDGPFPNQARKVIERMYQIIEQLEFENVVGLEMQNLTWGDYKIEDPQTSQHDL